MPRIFLSSLLLISLLFCRSLTAVALDTDIGLDVKEVTASSDDPTETGSAWTSLLSTSHLIENIQRGVSVHSLRSYSHLVIDTYIPPAFRLSGAIQTFVTPNPSPSDWWDKAKEYEQILQDYVPRLLKSAADFFKSTDFTDITSSMKNILHATATFRDNIKDALDAQHISLDTFTKELESIFAAVVHDLENIPPPDKAPGHPERKEVVDKILDDTELAFINLATRYGIDVEVVTAYLSKLRPQVQALIVAVGDINEQHPQLLPAVVFSIAGLLIPESWILRPFLSMFGFGPTGPVKGSVAAWLQRFFWGAKVTPGSWFSWLQAAGMGNIPKWAGPAIKIPLAFLGGLLGVFLPCFNGGTPEV